MDFIKYFFTKKILLLTFIGLNTFNSFCQYQDSKIYCSALKLFSNSNYSMVVVNETIDSKVNFKWINRSVGNMDTTTVVNFNKSAALISELKVRCIPNDRMISKNTFDHIDFDSKKKFSKFSKQFKKEPQIIQVSNIGVNDNQDQAIIEIRRHTKQGNTIQIIIMKKQYGEWVFSRFYDPIVR